MQALRVGWQNWKANFILVPVIYGLKLGLALLFTLPILVLVSASTAYSVYPAPLMSRWDFDVIAELIRTQSGVAPTMAVVLVSFTLLAFLAKQFLNGGLYTSYGRGGLSIDAFLGESARQFTSHLKISILMMPVYLLLISIGAQFARLVPETLTGHFGRAATGGLAARLAVVVAFVLIGIVISEALRQHRATYPDRHGKRRVTETLDFLRTRGVRLYACYLAYFVPFVAIWLSVEALAVAVTSGLANGLGVLLELALFQLCSCVRTGQSLLFTATAAPLFRAFPLPDPPVIPEDAVS